MSLLVLVWGIAGLALLALGIYLLARAIQRAHFEEKMRHTRRVLDLTKESD